MTLVQCSTKGGRSAGHPYVQISSLLVYLLFYFSKYILLFFWPSTSLRRLSKINTSKKMNNRTIEHFHKKQRKFCHEEKWGRMKFYGSEGIFNRKLVMVGASSGKSYCIPCFLVAFPSHITQLCMILHYSKQCWSIGAGRDLKQVSH